VRSGQLQSTKLGPRRVDRFVGLGQPVPLEDQSLPVLSDDHIDGSARSSEDPVGIAQPSIQI
jgi:hypothetical protein